ncbi:unnamed protein product [Caenorhabditis nigoni]
MKYSDLFLLSFVSKNTKKLIKSSQITRFQSIRHIMYDAIVNISKSDRTIGDKRFLGILVKVDGGNIMKTCERIDGTKNVYFQLNVSGKIMDFRLFEKFKFLEAHFPLNDKESAIESIHKYFLDFFGDTADYQWIVKHPDNFIPRLPNLSLCFCPDPYMVRDRKILETFFASHPVMKHIDMRLDTPEPFSPESKLYQTESFRGSTEQSQTVSAFLRHFQGRQATLFFCDCEISELIEFMNRWRSGEGSQKLEYLDMRLTRSRNLKAVLNANGVKHIDASKKPPTHTVPNL